MKTKNVILWAALSVATSAFAQAAAQAVAPVAVPDVTGVQGWLELLRSGGPLTIAIVAGFWAYRKDGEAKEAQSALIAAAAKTQNDMIGITKDLTAAITKMEDTLDDLSSAVKSLKE